MRHSFFIFLILVISTIPARGESLPDASGANPRSRLLMASESVDPTQRADELLEGSIDPALYRVDAGDRFQIEVLGTVSVFLTPRVDLEGWIALGEFGSLQVAGMTLDAARVRIRAHLASRIRDSEIDVRLLQMRRFKVFVTGRVASPGSYPANGVTRVSEVIRLAGGLVDSASTRTIRVHRSDEADPLLVDLAIFRLAGDLAQNPFLRDGDRVVVPPRTATFSVTGAVEHPGTWDLRDGDSLEGILDWVKPLPGAELTRVTVARFRDPDGGGRGDEFDEVSVNVEQELAGGARWPLQDGDRIRVPRIARFRTGSSVILDGEVRYPGSYPIEPGTDRLSSVLARAGGLLPDSQPSRIELIRRADTDTVAFAEEIMAAPANRELTPSELAWLQLELQPDADRVILNAAEGDDPVLAAGDRILVPRRTEFVRVAGQVASPGLYLHRDDWKPADYLKAAGGTTRTADRGRTRLIRGAGASTDLSKAGSIEAGDLLFVPEKRPKSRWEVVRDLVGTLAQAATIVIVIDQVAKQ